MLKCGSSDQNVRRYEAVQLDPQPETGETETRDSRDNMEQCERYCGRCLETSPYLNSFSLPYGQLLTGSYIWFLS